MVGKPPGARLLWPVGDYCGRLYRGLYSHCRLTRCRSRRSRPVEKRMGTAVKEKVMFRRHGLSAYDSDFAVYRRGGYARRPRRRGVLKRRNKKPPLPFILADGVPLKTGEKGWTVRLQF